MLALAYAQVIGKDIAYRDAAVEMLRTEMSPLTAGETRRSNALATHVN